MKDNKDPKKKSGKNTDKKPVNDKQHGSGAPKSEVDNQWATTNQSYFPDERERRDGPGGENG